MPYLCNNFTMLLLRSTWLLSKSFSTLTFTESCPLGCHSGWAASIVVPMPCGAMVGAQLAGITLPTLSPIVFYHS